MDDTNDLRPPFDAAGVIPLGDSEEEKEAFQRLQRSGPNDRGEQLLSKVADCRKPLRDLEQRTEAALASLLANATAVAVAVSTSQETYQAFVAHPYWRGKRPGTNKLLLRVLQLHLQPGGTNERKMLSRYASAITWLVLRGFDPDTLVDGLAQEGGVAACATKHAAWRREQRAMVNSSGTEATGQLSAHDTMASNPVGNSGIGIVRRGKRAPEPASTTPSSTPTTPPAPLLNEDKQRLEAVQVKLAPEVQEQILRGAPPVNQETFYGRFTRTGNVITLAELHPHVLVLKKVQQRPPVIQGRDTDRLGSASGVS